MAEYIEREKLAKALKIWQTALIENYGENDEYVRCLDAVLLGVDNVPAADVRPVVRCKDCKNDCHCMIQDFMEDYGITPDDQNNFFCGYGEKEDKKDER
jgi:hypothetical protein